MQTIVELAPDRTQVPASTLTLPFEMRQKSRMRVTLDDGEEIGVVLPRGTVLRDGDKVRDEAARIIEIKAAPESVSTIKAATPDELARLCYHLGNRHVPLQIGQGWARYQHDHVLDDMVRQLGGEVLHEHAPFEPESGAYHSHGHSHTNAHHHSHD